MVRKKTMICNSFIHMLAAAIMLGSKSSKSYEMVILARILYGYSTGEMCHLTSSQVLLVKKKKKRLELHRPLGGSPVILGRSVGDSEKGFSFLGSY